MSSNHNTASMPASYDSNPLWITVSVMLATLMYTLDTTIANVSLPHMQGSMRASQEQIAWVLTSYIVASAIAMPLTGFIAERFGRKKLFIISTIGFTLTSMLCGAAQNLEQIVVFRMLQGVFGAPLVPLSQSVMLDTYPREKHGSAMAMWGMGVMVGPILGPTLGGWLTEYYTWRWVFYINIPVGMLAWLGITLYVKETESNRSRRFDLLGFVFLSVAIGSLQMMLDRGESLNWFHHPEIVAELALSILALYLFIVHIFTMKHPFLEPQLFADRNFCIGMIIAFVVGIILLATAALLPPYLQKLGGYPVIDVGFILAPRGVGIMLAMLIVGRLSQMIDARHMILFGLFTTSFSLWLMTRFTNDMGPQPIITSGFIQGVGLGFIFVPLSTVTFSTLAQHFRNEGTSLNNLVRSIGSSIGISMVMANLAHETQANHASFAPYITPFNLALNKAVEEGVYNLGSSAGLAALNGTVNQQALTLAYLQDFHMMMWLTLFVVPLLLFMKSDKVKSR